MKRALILAFSLCGLAATLHAHGGEVWITPRLESTEVIHQGQPVIVKRNQDPRNKVNPLYAYTSRKCPPFCILPIKAAPGVDTVGELEVLGYLHRIAQGDESVLVVDTRTAKWPQRGMIPGAVNIPWKMLDPQHTESQAIGRMLYDKFGAAYRNGRWDYSPAKTLVLYCNGMWCSQSTTAIERLLHYGYPAKKLKWYRGGMQNWENLGLTTVRASDEETD